jgi:hypothetical protein
VLLMLKCCAQPEAQSSNFRSKILEAISARLHRRLIAESFQFFTWIHEFGESNRGIKVWAVTWPCSRSAIFFRKVVPAKRETQSMKSSKPQRFLSDLPIELSYIKR